jgi:multiple sugar transport system ATP-binding protein
MDTPLYELFKLEKTSGYLVVLIENPANVWEPALQYSMGPPQELYDHPANLFVAGFIGSPAMNFFEGARVEGDGDQMKMVIDQVGQIVVPPLYRGMAKAVAGKQLTFGIRPENLQDAAFRPPGAENGTVIIAPVDVVEHLGRELLVYLAAAAKSMTARLDPRSDAHTVGQVKLHDDNARMHRVDSGTGEAIF